MREKFEHRGSLDAVRSKLKRIKKKNPRYFIIRDFTIKDAPYPKGTYILTSKVK
tara:strand:+ start:1756 stop:1917 length:162 start_codon:yes stop_codon:yes gene_type:complete